MLDGETSDSTPTVIYAPTKPSQNTIVDGLPKYLYSEELEGMLADLPYTLVMPIGIALTIAMFWFF